MPGYTKLFSDILTSSVWQTSMPTRIVWIAMLALKDKEGYVAASLPGLAHAARVSFKECEEAIKELSAPDQYSRTKDFDGRRIEQIEGGWYVLNHDLYRDRLSTDSKATATRERVRRFRANQKKRYVTPETVTSCYTVYVDVLMDTLRSSKEGTKGAKGNSGVTKEQRSQIVSDASEVVYLCQGTAERVKLDSMPDSVRPEPLQIKTESAVAWIYSHYPRKVGKKKACEAIEKAIANAGYDTVMDGVLRFEKARAGEDSEYTPHPSTWFNQERWEDEE